MKILGIEWTPEKRRVTDLKNWEQNPRQITEEATAKLKDKIIKEGFHDVIKIDTDNTIISGNQRNNILLQLGIAEVWCFVPERKLSDEERVKIALSSNNHWGIFVNELLAPYGKDVLEDSGFGSKEIDRILRSKLKEDNFDAEEEAENKKEPIAKLGDIYRLGKHRLMCGDSTNAEHVSKLMAGTKAGMLFTDPPYNIAYTKLSHNMRETAKDWSYCSDWGDKMTDEAYQEFLIKTLANAKAHLIENAHYYVWFAFVYYRELLAAFEENKISFDKVPLIWMKQTTPISWARYHRNYEPCIFAGEKLYTGVGSRWFGDKNETTIWQINTDHNGTYVHPTQKPIALAARAIQNSSQRGESVLELFGGSGSTLMACDQLDRPCYCMELDPVYVDVIIARWEKMTGLKGEKINA